MEDIAAVKDRRADDRSNMAVRASTRYQLCYRPLSCLGPGFAFPCDAAGTVVLDDLSERALENYLYARAVTGSELAWPSIERQF